MGPKNLNGKKIFLRGLHSVVGEPMKPSGQVHTGSCPTTRQVARGAQGSLTAHGLMQSSLSHAA